MKRLVSIVAALALCLGASVALARGPLAPGASKKFIKKLGLDDKQTARIDELTYQADLEKLDLEHEMRKSRLDLERLMSADRPNQAAIFSRLEAISALELKVKKNRVGLMLKVRALLTSEQWEKLQELQARRRVEFREKRVRRRSLPDSTPGSPDFPEPPPGP